MKIITTLPLFPYNCLSQLPLVRIESGHKGCDRNRENIMQAKVNERHDKKLSVSHCERWWMEGEGIGENINGKGWLLFKAGGAVPQW
jgi:hypothetical protein